jgi:hypothetical protein
VFTIIAVVFVLPYILVAFGFFPKSGFAQRVHPSNDEILAALDRQTRELTKIRKDKILRGNSDSELECFDIQTDAIVTIGETILRDSSRLSFITDYHSLPIIIHYRLLFLLICDRGMSRECVAALSTSRLTG